MTHTARYWLKEARLTKGSHRPNGEACVMEAASQLLAEPWSDRPKGIDPQIAAFCRVLNDRFGPPMRAELQRRLPRIIKARKLPDEYRFKWAEFARQEAIRALGPERSAELAALPPITDKASAYAAANAAYAAANAAHVAAAYAAANAAYAAADAAAANAAADAAAADAANAADAAAYAAYADAYAAANAANAAAVKGGKTRCLAELDRALDVAEALNPSKGGGA